MEVSGQLHALVASPPEKEPPVLTGWEVEWDRRWSGCGGEEKHSLPQPEIELRLSSP
jgi:hypothetical protein